MICRKLNNNDIVWFNSVGREMGEKGSLILCTQTSPSVVWVRKNIYFVNYPQEPKEGDLYYNNNLVKEYTNGTWVDTQITVIDYPPETPTVNQGYKELDCWVKKQVSTDKTDYAGKQEGTAYSLKQRLSVIRGELWYQINHGLPLMDKLKNKAVLDSAIIDIIYQHPSVANIDSYKSEINQNHIYNFTAVINTIYNEQITIGSSYSY